MDNVLLKCGAVYCGNLIRTTSQTTENKLITHLLLAGVQRCLCRYIATHKYVCENIGYDRWTKLMGFWTHLHRSAGTISKWGGQGQKCNFTLSGVFVTNIIIQHFRHTYSIYALFGFMTAMCVRLDCVIVYRGVRDVQVSYSPHSCQSECSST